MEGKARTLSQRAFAAGAALAALATGGDAAACEPRLAPLPGYGATAAPWDRLGCNLADAATGPNLLFYAAAVLTTMELSASGADHRVRVVFEEDLGSRGLGDAMVVAGFIGPPATGVLLYGLGLAGRSRELAGGGAAALQAMTLTFATTVLAKALTGRPYPQHGGDPRSPDRLRHPEWAREWNGPALRDGAWPSGHTAVATSLAAALTAYHVEARWVPLLTYPAAAAVAVGMLSGAHHWLSDVVAGALVGHAMGWSIGADFRRMQDARDAGGAATARGRVQLVPFAGGTGLSVTGPF